MFQKVYTRFVHWELFDDEDIHMAGLSLKVMANSGQIVNLVIEKNIKRLVKVYDDNEMVALFLSFALIQKTPVRPFSVAAPALRRPSLLIL